MIILITVILSFLFGSIPTGYLLAKKFYNIDIRTKGSGNIGSTNVKRIVGTKLSIITQIIDILKGLITVTFGLYFSQFIQTQISADTYISIIALTVILGHDFTPFLKFNGGKGVNTTIGAFFLLAPFPTLAGVLVYFALGLFIPIVSVRSISLGITIPLLCIVIKFPISIIISAILACILMLMRHKENIKRIIYHQEK